MKAFIYLLNVNEPFEAKESYATVKKRLYDNQNFIEITREAGGKVIFDKESIWQVEAREVTEVKKGRGGKSKK